MPGELLLITGPPAVGKMTVGRAICERSAFKLVHNHLTIEPLLEVFEYGSPPFNVLNEEFRQRLIEESATAGVRLVFTFVWGVDLPSDAEAVRGYMRPYLDAGLPVSFVELDADLPTRLGRNSGADRILAKPSKRDLAWSDDNVRSLERFRMVTDPAQPSAADQVIGNHPHLRLNTSSLSAAETAERILAWIGR
ncbi:MAG: AAA family ATPase [Propionibacteriaceae bacterium]|nr:AAA family ATPase [Propionibacteriaceae bacterium]